MRIPTKSEELRSVILLTKLPKPFQECRECRVGFDWEARKSVFHVNDVRAGPQSCRYAAWLAGGDHDVVIVGNRQGIQNRCSFFRLHQCQIFPEVMETLPIGVSGRCVGEIHVLAGEMFGQGRSYGDGALVGWNRSCTGRGIVKNDAQAALVFTRELAYVERAGF